MPSKPAMKPTRTPMRRNAGISVRSKLVPCPAIRSIVRVEITCLGRVARPHRTVGYAFGGAPCLPPDFIRSFIFEIHETGHYAFSIFLVMNVHSRGSTGVID